jgi:hypothetical protein
MLENTRAYSGFAVDDVQSAREFSKAAIHFWWLERRDATTFVRTAESCEGVVVRLFRRAAPEGARQWARNRLRHLKAQANSGRPERRARDEGCVYTGGR